MLCARGELNPMPSSSPARNSSEIVRWLGWQPSHRPRADRRACEVEASVSAHRPQPGRGPSPCEKSEKPNIRNNPHGVMHIL